MARPDWLALGAWRGVAPTQMPLDYQVVLTWQKIRNSQLELLLNNYTNTREQSLQIFCSPFKIGQIDMHDN